MIIDPTPLVLQFGACRLKVSGDPNSRDHNAHLMVGIDARFAQLEAQNAILAAVLLASGALPLAVQTTDQKLFEALSIPLCDEEKAVMERLCARLAKQWPHLIEHVKAQTKADDVREQALAAAAEKEGPHGDVDQG